MKEDIYSLTYAAEEEHWWYVARRKIILDAVRRTLRPCAGTPRILDYGCGTGSILAAMSELGEAYGLDMSESAVAYCTERRIARVAHVPIEKAGEYANPFGVSYSLITMLDVLEHIPDDEGALRGIGAWLEPGGALMVAVPAYEFLWSGEDYVSHHQRRYTASGLKATLRHAGFEIAYCSYFNSFLFPVQVAAVLFLRTFRPRSMYETLVRKTAPSLNGFLEKVFAAERSVLPIMPLPFGGSILCIARRA